MLLIGTHTDRTAAAAFLGVLVMAICLLPLTGYAAEEDARVKPVKSPDDVICKREKISGSQTKQRICFTREQWDDIRRQSQSNASNAMRGGGPITPQ